MKPRRWPLATFEMQSERRISKVAIILSPNTQKVLRLDHRQS